MKNTFFMILAFVLLLGGLHLFSQKSSSTAQPQMTPSQGERPGMGQPGTGQPAMGQPGAGQPEDHSGLNQELEKYSLPSAPITENDISGIKAVIRDVLDGISEYLKNPPSTSSGMGFMMQPQAEEKPDGSDLETIKSGILIFRDWLNQQDCVENVSTPYDVESVDKYQDNIFLAYPGQLPFNIDFNMEEGVEKYRLLVFVSKVDLLDFASIIENNTDSGVPVPDDWPVPMPMDKEQS